MAKAWVDTPYHGQNIAGEYQIVFQRDQAAEMSNANAQQLMRTVQTAYPDYLWEMVSSGKFFIVEGTKKK